MLTFLIMAGGSGERFWPLSTRKNPKQLLKVFNEKSLLRLTYERVLPLVDRNRIFISTNEMQVEALKKDMPEVDNSRIIIEPAFRDTASAISYGSLIISKYISNPTICVLASDHLIADEEEFRNVILKAVEEADSNGNIVTLGIKPSYPETGYGYIKVENNVLNTPEKSLAFKEKPNREVAEEYYSSGKYLWNSGMFIFQYNVMMENLKKHSFNHYDITEKLNAVITANDGTKTANAAKPLFEQYEKKSIDYAVIEKSENIMVIPSEFGWNDVGSFLAFDELFKDSTDENGNVVVGIKCVKLDSNNNIIISTAKEAPTVSLLGVSNMIVAITEHDILILAKKDSQRIKELLKVYNN